MFYPYLIWVMMTGLGYDLGVCTMDYQLVNGHQAPGYYCVAEPEPEPELEKPDEDVLGMLRRGGPSRAKFELMWNAAEGFGEYSERYTAPDTARSDQSR